MGTPRLFEPLAVGRLQLANRIVIAPMCQYSAVDGCMTDWHLIHLGQLSHSGAALLTIEATAVLPEGRITDGDVGLWDDASEAAMAVVLQGVRRWSAMPVAIQLAHAGRKASCALPWHGGRQVAPGQARSWQTLAPSALPFNDHDHAPVAMTRKDIDGVTDAFAAAARRAARLGIDAVQVHAAHGYLLHQFLSPLSNRRSDEYGGSLENRMRFPLQVFDAVRAGAGSARLQRHPRVQRRAAPGTGDRGRPRLPGTAGARGEAGGGDAGGGGGDDHRLRPRRGDRRQR